MVLKVRGCKVVSIADSFCFVSLAFEPFLHISNFQEKRQISVFYVSYYPQYPIQGPPGDKKKHFFLLHNELQA